MQAIITKSIGPSNTRGSRVKAVCSVGSITIPYNHEVSHFEVHKEAVNALLVKFGWKDQMLAPFGGQLPSGEYVWVFPYDEFKA